MEWVQWWQEDSGATKKVKEGSNYYLQLPKGKETEKIKPDSSWMCTVKIQQTMHESFKFWTQRKNFVVRANIGMGWWISALGNIQNMAGQGPGQPDLSCPCLVQWSLPDDLQRQLASQNISSQFYDLAHFGSCSKIHLPWAAARGIRFLLVHENCWIRIIWLVTESSNIL